MAPTQVGTAPGGRSAEVVVYCTNPDCTDSVDTARRLQELGYTNVRHYSGGKEEWREAGLSLERAGKLFVPQEKLS